MVAWLALAVSLVSLLLTYAMYRRMNPWISWSVVHGKDVFMLRNDGSMRARNVRVAGRNVASWGAPRSVAGRAAEPITLSNIPAPAQTEVTWSVWLWERRRLVPLPAEHIDDPGMPDGGGPLVY